MRFCHTKSIGTSRTLILSINRIVRFRGAPIVFIRVQAHSNQFRYIRTFGQNLSKSSDCVSYSGLVLLCLKNGSDNSIQSPFTSAIGNACTATVKHSFYENIGQVHVFRNRGCVTCLHTPRR